MRKNLKIISTICCLTLALAMLAFGVYAAVTSAQVGITSSVSYTAEQYVKADIFAEQGATGVQTAIARSPQLQTIDMTTTSATPTKSLSFTAPLTHNGTAEQIEYRVKLVVKNKSEATDDNTKLYVSFAEYGYPNLSDDNFFNGHRLSVVGAKTTVGELSTYADGAALPALTNSYELSYFDEFELLYGQACEIDIILKVNVANSLSEPALNINLNLTKQPTQFHAEPVVASSDWTVTEGVVTAYNGTATDIVVPNVTADDIPIIAVNDNLFKNNTNITSVDISEGILVIGESAFEGCSGLTEITIPSTVTSIGNSAFRGCVSVETLNYNAINCADFDQQNYVFSQMGYTKVDTAPLMGQLGMSSVGASSQQYPGCSVIIGEGVTKLPAYLFCGDITACFAVVQDSSKLMQAMQTISFATNLTIPKSLTTIGTRAFAFNAFLTSVTIPSDSSLQTLGEGAFSGNMSLQSIVLPNSLQTIGAYAFTYCFALGTINIPANVTSIGEVAFASCSNLQTVNISNNSKLKTIGVQAFGECTSLTGITIPASVTSIGGNAFFLCMQMEEVIFVASVQNLSLGEGVFDGCECLTTINLTRPTNSNTYIGNKLEEFIQTSPFSDSCSLTECSYKINGSGSYTTWQGQGVYTKIV